MDVTFGGDQFTTNDDSAIAKSDQKPEGIAPVMMSQLLATEGTHFQMWGMTFGMIKCVAIIRSIEISTTKIVYLLEDHTGQIEANYWTEEGVKPPDVMVNSYARIYATLRTHSGKKLLMIIKMLPISSINELTTHLLEVLNARYSSEKYHKGGLSDFSNTLAGTNPISMEQDLSNNLGLTGKNLVIYQAIKAGSKKGDVNIQELQSKFSHISMQELESIVDFLAQEGHIYASIDSNHYLCTDA